MCLLCLGVHAQTTMVDDIDSEHLIIYLCTLDFFFLSGFYGVLDLHSVIWYRCKKINSESNKLAIIFPLSELHLKLRNADDSGYL